MNINYWHNWYTSKISFLLSLIFLGCPHPYRKLNSKDWIKEDSIFVHRYSGINFPREINGLRRTGIEDFSDRLLDIGVKYQEEHSKVTVYVYPIPQYSRLIAPTNIQLDFFESITKDHFEDCKRELLAGQSHLDLLVDTTSHLIAGVRSIPVHIATFFGTNDSNQVVYEYIGVTTICGFYLKVRLRWSSFFDRKFPFLSWIRGRVVIKPPSAT